MWLVDSIKDFFKRGDLLLLTICLLASGYGIAMIYSAGGADYAQKQAISVALGVLVYIACSFVDVDMFLEKGWKLLPLISLVLLGLLQVFGVVRGGNKNWLEFSFLPFSIQPTELTKITFILLLAYQINRLKREDENRISSISSILQLCAHLLVMVGLIFVISGDAGMCVTYLFIFAAMLWAAKVKLRWFALAGFLLVIALVAAIFAYHQGLLPSSLSYMFERVAVVFDHSLDPLGMGYQQGRSILAIGSGQIFGQGYLQGTQTQSVSGLPEKRTDFIFAVIGEELGMVGCLLALLVLSAIIIRCLYVSHVAASECSAQVCVGFAAMVLIQMVVNVGMCLYIMPVIGLTLPFFSYGGSSIISLFASMGLVSSVKMRSLPSWLRDRKDRML